MGKSNILIQTIIFTILITGLSLIVLIDEGVRLYPIATTAWPTPTPEPPPNPELPTLPPAEPIIVTPEPPSIPELPTLPAESSLFLLKPSLPEPAILTLIFSS